MNFATFLEVNGALHGGSRRTRGFELPDKQMIYRSVRFGDHAFDLKRKNVMIIPVTNGQSVESVSTWAKICSSVDAALRPVLRSSATANEEFSSLFSTGASMGNTTCMPASRNRLWRTWPGGIIDMLSVCMERALSFFQGTGQPPVSRIELERSGIR